MVYDEMIEEAAARFRARAEAERRAREEATRAARAALPALVAALRERGARKILLIGSVRWNRAGPDSDIDLVVFGLPQERLEEARETCAALAGRHVDVLRAEEMDRDYLPVHERHGEVIHDG